MHFRDRCIGRKGGFTISIDYSRFLDYDKREDGTHASNEGRSKIVRFVFQLFLAVYKTAVTRTAVLYI